MTSMCFALQFYRMEWLVEFDERRVPLTSVWSEDMEKLVGPLKSMVDQALAAAPSPEDLDRLKLVLYVETNEGSAPEWGFKLVGPGYVVDYARRLIGDTAPIRPTAH